MLSQNDFRFNHTTRRREWVNRQTKQVVASEPMTAAEKAYFDAIAQEKKAKADALKAWFLSQSLAECLNLAATLTDLADTNPDALDIDDLPEGLAKGKLWRHIAANEDDLETLAMKKAGH